MKLKNKTGIGVNYWASHAGTAMWQDWQPDVIARDFKLLADHGIEIVRLFPLWPDFQPLTPHLLPGSRIAEMRQGEKPFPDTELGRAGIDAIAMEKFTFLIQEAEKYGIKLIVGLITGWMSGRLFVPPALVNRNLITDPLALKWQVKFVRAFVRHFKNSATICAWDLGNECNVMAQAPSAEAAWHWTASITNAIRAEDQTRSIISGMHGLSPTGIWKIQDQAENCDYLTTHPYPLFTPHCDVDPLDSIRTIMHATAESSFYAGIGNTPCFVEEIGNLGPMMGNEATTARFLRANLFSLWAHGHLPLLWWCAFDQNHLDHPPYDWVMMERELGLFTADHQPKKHVAEFRRFQEFREKFPLVELPPPERQVVCILTEDQDHWAAAFSSFILAKQAGFTLDFQYQDQPLKKSQCYLMPSVTGLKVMKRQRWQELLDRVKQGATLYISLDDGHLSEFEAVTGLQVQSRQRRNQPVEFQPATADLPSFTATADSRLNLVGKGAKILARETDGNPLFTQYHFGSGTVFFLALPMEKILAGQPGIFEPEGIPYYQIYRSFLSQQQPIISFENPNIGITEHVLDRNHRIFVLINYTAKTQSLCLNIHSDWKLKTINSGAKDVTSIAGNDALILEICR